MSDEAEEDSNKLQTVDGEVGSDGGRGPGKMASLPVRDLFVQPSSFLMRPRGHSRPMPPTKPETAVEREQRRGLVLSLLLISSMLDAADTAFNTAKYSSLPESSHQL